jgi:RNA polymerase sigma-70 factor (ECF subfamily)
VQDAPGATLGQNRDLGMSDDAFARHRRLLFTVAYEMLGSASDAEDVVQETWLRWADVDHASVREPRAYLVRIVTRQALNRLRTLARRREDYVGEWLPEPLVTSPDVAADVELAESLSMAMLTVLETLGPAERAVFVLREVFDTPYARSQRRSANHLPPFARSPTGLASTSLLDVHGCRSPRRAKGDSGPVPCRHPARRPAGPPRRLGPRRRCPRRRRRRGSRCSCPVKGAERVASLLLRGLRTVAFEAAAVWLNGSPAIRIDARTAFNAAVSVAVEDGRITHIYVVANPQKLARLDGITPLTRS